ncbi:MAG TPA: ABC transporter ATP-binding protein/permease [Bradyrhizobium sp.]|nr:ABC transporter ATP-binding protein/permease [Bradyrhizobium sp.]
MKNIRATLAIVWRIATPYFKSEDKWAGCSLLAAVIAIELASVGLDVLFNQWRNRFYNSLQEKDWDGFTHNVIFFTVLAAISVATSVYQLYLNQWLQIRWRNWMTTRYLGDWLEGANHYRMQLRGDAADNPDQRIADDTKLFVDRTLDIGLTLLNSIVTFVSFVIILWGLSEEAPLSISGVTYAIPGYLVWAALIYSVFGTVLTQWIGAPLVNLDFEQQRREADFRFNLVRTRENAEQIALLDGERAERTRLLDRFGGVVSNWYAIMSRTKRLTAFTASFSQAAVIIPLVLIAPAYFAGKILLGSMVQAAEAFGSVQKALSFVVQVYRTMAEWRAVVARLDGFEMSVASAAHLKTDSGSISVKAGGDEIDLDKLLVRLPGGAPLIAADSFRIRGHERMLLAGPSGAGKSTLFRAIAGIWPFGSGSISVPGKSTLMMLPQKPYFPIGSLHAAIAYPSEASSFAAERVKEVLQQIGLPQLAAKLDEKEHWNRILSLGEQQRLGIARALLQAPKFLFLDEATASLDEPAETALYRLLEEKLPDSTIVSIGHRSTLEAFHQRKAALKREDDHYALPGSN